MFKNMNTQKHKPRSQDHKPISQEHKNANEKKKLNTNGRTKDIVLKEFLVQNLYTFFHKNQLYIQPKIVILKQHLS